MQNPLFSKEAVEDFVYNRFNSLDTLISKGKWENDYPIKLIEAITLYKDVNDENLKNWKIKWDKALKANKKIKQIANSFSTVLKSADINDEEYLKNQVTDYLNRLEELMPDLLPDKNLQIKINIFVMLNFIIRKYKDDRNLIIHGNFEALNHKWKNYINFSALLKVCDTYKLYREFYLGVNNK